MIIDIHKITSVPKEIICGIYKITSPSGKIYIGKSKNNLLRFYKYSRLNGCKPQIRLYNSFKKYGVLNHKFEIIERCLESILSEREIFYIKEYDTFNTKHGLNLRGGGEGGTLTPEAISRIRAKLKGKKKSESQKKKMSESRKGIYPPQLADPEVKRRGVVTRTGVPMPEYLKKKMSDLRKGIPNLKLRGVVRCEEYIQKQKVSHIGQKAWNKGIPRTEAEKKKMSDSKMGKPNLKMRGRAKSEEHKEKLRQANLGKKHPAEVNAKKGRKGRTPWHKGKKMTDEQKSHLKGKWAGENNPKFGKPMDPDHKEKLRKINLGRKRSAESIAKQVATSKQNRIQIEQERRTMIF